MIGRRVVARRERVAATTASQRSVEASQNQSTHTVGKTRADKVFKRAARAQRDRVSAKDVLSRVDVQVDGHSGGRSGEVQRFYSAGIRQRVCAARREQVRIVVRSTVQRVIAQAIGERIVATVARQRVVACVTSQSISHRTTDDVLKSGDSSSDVGRRSGRQIDSHTARVAGVVNRVVVGSAVDRTAHSERVVDHKVIIAGSTSQILKVDECRCDCGHAAQNGAVIVARDVEVIVTGRTNNRVADARAGHHLNIRERVEVDRDRRNARREIDRVVVRSTIQESRNDRCSGEREDVVAGIAVQRTSDISRAGNVERVRSVAAREAQAG